MYINPMYQENPFYMIYQNRVAAYHAIDVNILPEYREYFYVVDSTDSEEDKEYKSYTG